MKNIQDWLEDKIEARARFGMAAQDAGEFSMLAGVLRGEAQAEGYDLDDLDDICGGDIAHYLLSYTNSRLPAEAPMRVQTGL